MAKKKRVIIGGGGRTVVKPNKGANADMGGDKSTINNIDKTTPSRGSSIQGERQNAKGGPAGANQGGASRGSSRLEPSHVKNAIKRTQGK